MTTTDDQEIAGTDVANPALGTVEAFKAHIAKLTKVEDEDVQGKILALILAADTPTDLLNAGSSIPAESIAGQSITVHAIRADESLLPDGQDFYLHVDASYNGNGRHFTFSTGSMDLTAKLVSADMRGWFPLRCRVERAERPTKAGYFPLFLRALNPDDEPF